MLNKGENRGPYVAPNEAIQSTQTITLQEGWNIISSSVAPTNPDLEAVLGEALSEVGLVKDEQGQVFNPVEDIDQIGSWDPQEAYLIYVDQSTSLTIEGFPVDPETAINLAEGWNLVPFFEGATSDIIQALGNISNQLVLVKDNVGNIYHPASGLNQIGALQPGMGYKIYASDGVILSYPLPD